MPDHRTLLQRLRAPDAQADRSQEEDTRLLMRSVMENLRELLNTQQGSSKVDPDYGLPSMASVVHSFPAGAGSLERAIKATIAKYEPRLRSIRVRSIASDKDPFRLHFEIRARLQAGKRSLPFQVQTAVDGAGRVLVKH